MPGVNITGACSGNPVDAGQAIPVSSFQVSAIYSYLNSGTGDTGSATGSLTLTRQPYTGQTPDAYKFQISILSCASCPDTQPFTMYNGSYTEPLGTGVCDGLSDQMFLGATISFRCDPVTGVPQFLIEATGGTVVSQCQFSATVDSGWMDVISIAGTYHLNYTNAIPSVSWAFTIVLS
jgi:hypothetical protein